MARRHDHIVQIPTPASQRRTSSPSSRRRTDLQDYIERAPRPLDIPRPSVTIQAAKLDHATPRASFTATSPNFLITTRSGKLSIKLTDMGLARTEDDSASPANHHPGTVDYISPESARPTPQTP